VRLGLALGWRYGLVLGMAAGLVLGLIAHPATAWFAVFELGIPVSLLGLLLGALAGALVARWRHLRRRA
jgi:hypothetical protein